MYDHLVGNMSENHSLEEEIRLRDEEYRILHEAVKILNTDDDLQSRLKRTLLALTRFRGLEVEQKAGIFLLDEEKKFLRLFCTVGEFTEEFLEKEKEIPCGQCLCGRVAESGELITSSSCFSDERHENKFEGMTGHGHYIIPLKNMGKVIGVLFLYTDENPSWYVRCKEILTDVSGLIAKAVVYGQTINKTRNKTE